MDVHDYLQQLHFTMLQRMARSHRCRIEQEEGETLPEQVQVHLTSSEGVQECFSYMTVEEKEVLRFLLLFAERPWVTLQEMGQWSSLPGLDIQKGFNLLWLKGILYVQRRFWGEEVFAMPRDVFQAWMRVLVMREGTVHNSESEKGRGEKQKGVQQERKGEARKQEIQVTGSYPPFYQDQLMLLAYISQHEVILTQKETIHKRTVKKMEESLLIPKRFPERLTWYPYPHQETYNPGFAFLLDTCFRLGLLFSDGFVLRVDERSLDAWFRQSPYDVMAKNYEMFKEVYLANIRTAYRVLLVMESLPGEEAWHSWEEVVQLLEKMRQVRLTEKELEASRRILMELLPLIGIIETGQSKTNEMWRWTLFSPYRLKDRPPVEEKFFLQPGYEILVSPFLNLWHQWQIAQMSRLKQRDQVMQFFFDQETVNQAFEGGMKLTDILHLLELGALSPVPSHIITSLEEWGRQYGRITFTDCVVMTCDDEQLAREIQLNPKLQPFVLGQLNECHLIVSRERLQQLIQWLDKLGYHPRKRVEIPEKWTSDALPGFLVQETEEGEDEVWGVSAYYQEGLYALDAGRFGYQLVKELPDPREWSVSYHDMPSTWVKQFRSYHISTLKEMLQYAAKQHLQLQVDWQGKVFLFSPHKLITRQNEWEVVGWKDNQQDTHVKIPLSEVKRVKVIL